MALVEAVVASVEKTANAISEGMKKTAEMGKEISETAKSKIENVMNSGDAVKAKLEDIKCMTPEQLQEKMKENLDACDANQTRDGMEDLEGTSELSAADKLKIKDETGWSDEIIDAIGSMKEYQIYKDAGLQEAKIGDKICLIRNDIDWKQVDALGRTNSERANLGLSPINKDGKIIELHHIGQHADSPLAELTPEEHRGKGNDSILHDKTKDTEIDRQAFAGERATHWENRANEGSNS